MQSYAPGTGLARTRLALAPPILGIIFLSATDSRTQAGLHIQVTVVHAVPSPISPKEHSASANSITMPTSSLEIKTERHLLDSSSMKGKKQQEGVRAVLETVTVVAP